MEDTAYRAIAIVGAAAILPDAPNVEAFWNNVKNGRYSITEVTPDRWDPALYYDPDPAAPDKSYSKIGGWVRTFPWEPVEWRLAVPPRVVNAMDDAQKWAIACTREALDDYGYPARHLELDRTAVILGNAMAGEKHYLTSLRIYFPEYARQLSESASFAALPEGVRKSITGELHRRMDSLLPEVTEDSMPGELANCIAGRIANIYNFHGPNYVVDAACASAMAAINAAVEGLVQNEFDTAVTGGIDRNMGAPSFTKFCKIGALSATGSRPYAEGADGFVMGEGAVIFLLKRLADAERDGDKVYAVLRGIGGSSDGKGKGITAPNPIGQKFAIERAWQNAGLSPATVTYVEGHGTSTRVGDVVEVNSLAEVLSKFHLPTGAVALGSVKSNIGHLKSAAGAAGLLKAVLALRDKVLPPTVHCDRLSPDIDFSHMPLSVNRELKSWPASPDHPRRAGASAFGFGGTNFHVVLEEHTPGTLTSNGKASISMRQAPPFASGDGKTARRSKPGQTAVGKAPLRGALLMGGKSGSDLAARLRHVREEAEAGRAPLPAPPLDADLRSPERLAIDYADAADLADKTAKAAKALDGEQAAVWKALRAQGIFRGSGPAQTVAFLYTGQGSQYVNMLQSLRAEEPIVAEAFAEADRVLWPFLGKPLSQFIFVDQSDPAAVARAEEDLRQTAITQPAVLAADLALTRVLAAYGIEPEMTMGHSLGEYGALVAAGALPFEDALEAVSARGREMTRISVEDVGKMAAVFAPFGEIEAVLSTVSGYVVIANVNSERQAVIGGATKAVEQACEVLLRKGFNVVPLTVSHAFHTSIVAPASEPLRRTLERLRVKPPRLPVVANVTGEFYPTGPDVAPQIVDILARQVAAPVQFVKGLLTLYRAGVRVFVEVGPKKALHGFVEDVLADRGDVVAIFTNHPKFGDIAAFNQALCGLYAAGHGYGAPAAPRQIAPERIVSAPAVSPAANNRRPDAPAALTPNAPTRVSAPIAGNHYAELGRMFADVLERGLQIYQGQNGARPSSWAPVVITGASLGLPGPGYIFAEDNVARILRGDQCIDVVPSRFRRAMLDKHIVRLMKNDNGGPTFETIADVSDVIKLAGRGGVLDLDQEFGVSLDRIPSLDRVTGLAIAAGINALRDAGIPLVMRYKTTSLGTQLPDRWGLPDGMRDDTGIIFASVFPGFDSFADEAARYYADHARREQLEMLESLRSRMTDTGGNFAAVQEIDHRIGEIRATLESEPYLFDRRFLFRVLSMGHSQFAEMIGARGPNTHLNAACASTTQAVSVAEDWIHTGRCRRVILVSADDVTTDHLIEWMGAGFLATGAAATEDVVEEVALPFDRRRHGMVMGMGAAAMVMESEEAARERGIRPICEVVSSIAGNSAFHGTRLDVEHICQVMENLVKQAEARLRIPRDQLAPRTVFVSHETYTPARGGSASAEISALRRVFGAAADQIVIANTKGLTGHAMGTGIEDVVAIKALETGCVPPVANFKEVDPELGSLNLSKGGAYPVEFALRLAAGFGSQISMTLMRLVPSASGVRPSPSALGYAYRIDDQAAWGSWLTRMTGVTFPDLEVVRHTLRVKDGGGAVRVAGPPAQRAQVVEAAPPEARVAAPPAPPEPMRVEQEDPLKNRVLAVVAEKTGYPPDMLDLDLDLEADLGIDTVKQAEVFATIREAYGIARDDRVRLRDFPTLAHVIRFVKDHVPQAAPAPGASSRPAVPQTEVDPVKQRVFALAAEKTGYPVEMLDLDLDLEADLGIDTVKQAEMFAAIREVYDIPRDDNVKLRDFPTLSHVIRFVNGRRPDLAVPAAPEPAAAPAPARPAAAAYDSVKEKVLGIAAEKTGYPIEMLDLDLDLEADLGIDTVKQAEMFAAIRSAYNIPRDENVRLRDFPTLSHVIQLIYQKRDDLAVEPAQPPASEDPVRAKVLAIVAEKTGYPKEMLDLDLDLEADLGIDTVKQAEMFASVRAAYDIPRDENLKLRDFPTLAHVIQFAQERSNGAGRKAPPAPPTPAAAAPTMTIAADMKAADRVRRRVPVPILRPALTMCKQTGVALGPGCRVIVMPDGGGVDDALARLLETLGAQVLRVDKAADTKSIAACLDAWIAAGPVHGVYWLPALDHEGDLAAMAIGTWREAIRVRVKALYATMRTLFEQIATPGTFLVSATRLGGQHGYDEAGAFAPLGGGVAGFTKTYKRERPGALVKAVDFGIDEDPAEIAERLIEETLRDPGAVEVGYKAGLRWSVGLEEQPAADGQPGLTLNNDSVFVITGAAGSIVSAITADLAAASGGTFYLLDLVPEPDPNNPDLERFVTDKEGLKRDLFARIQARGERATPGLVEKELAALERARAARSAIQAVRGSGGTVRYFRVDLRDEAGVAAVVDEIRERSGRIDVLMHAAGLERSRFLPDKDPSEFDLVFDVKCDGWFNLLHSIGEMPLAATVAFSSVAGRFGNGGQSDYSAANDLLCKIASSFRNTRPDTRAIAIDWTAWGGIGMATRGSIPKMMEAAGIDMLPAEAGIPVVRRELTAGGTRGEVVIAHRLGILGDEWDAAGGVDTEAAETDRENRSAARGPMIGKIVRMTLQEGLVMETSLDPLAQGFLNHHRIDGTPVLPGVMGIETFAEAAQWLLPGWHIEAIEDVDFLVPFKFYRDEPRTVTVYAQFRPLGEGIVANCRLDGARTLPGQTEPQITTHFRGRVRLSPRQPEPVTTAPPGTPASSVVEAADIYRLYFHGPAYQVMTRAWRDGNRIIGQMAKHLPCDHYPPEQPELMAPRLIELCFQAAELWQVGAQGHMGLPRHIDRVSPSPIRNSAEDGFYAVVTPGSLDGCFDAEVVDTDGNRLMHLEGYRMVVHPDAVDAEPLKALQAVTAGL